MLKMIEEILTSITRTHPQWKQLVSAVDHRVDRALAILRPHGIVDHRALLASLGWPLSLPVFTSAYSNGWTTNQVLNPLLNMQADLKLKYSEIFLALCNLQKLHIHYQEAEGLTALTDDDAIIKVAISINVAHYFEEGWSVSKTLIEALDYLQGKISMDYLQDRIGRGLLDEIIDAWTLSSIHKVAELAFRCLAFHRDMRPSMTEGAKRVPFSPIQVPHRGIQGEKKGLYYPWLNDLWACGL